MYNLAACSVKSEQPNLDFVQFWPESAEENPIERILVQQPEKCDADTIKLEDRDDVVLQELVPYWPITDTVKMGMHMFSEQSEVSTELEEGLCAAKNILSDRCTVAYKNGFPNDDDKSVTENFSNNYLYCSVGNNILPGTSEYNYSNRNGQCSACNATSECKCQTQNAVLKVTKPKCHTCDICNKSFTRRYRMVRHKQIHEEGLCAEKNFLSERCTVVYKNGLLSNDDKVITENFSKNYLYYSDGNNILPGSSEYNDSDINGQCSTCNATSKCKCQTQNTSLKVTKAKCHTCDICNKGFPYLSKLARHKMIHDEVKNFNCNICNKSFRHSSSLLKHKLTHSDNTNFSCDI